MSKFGQKIVGRLKNFVSKARSTKAQPTKAQSSKSLADTFTCHTVTLDLRPKAYRADDIIAVRKLLTREPGGVRSLSGRLALAPSARGNRESTPPAPSRGRFMDEIRINPQYWQQRLRASAKVKSGLLTHRSRSPQRRPLQKIPGTAVEKCLRKWTIAQHL